MNVPVEVAKVKAAWYYLAITFVIAFILGSLR